MKTRLIIGFIGQDQPGLIRSLTDVVNSHQGNWLESRMNELAGRFAGIALVELNLDKVDAVKLALASLPHINIWTEQAETESEIKNTRALGLNIVGPDRPGILHDVTVELEKHVANVVEMETNISAAPMSGELTFSADAVVEVDYEMDWSVIGEQLDAVATNLGVDILLEDDAD